MSSSKPGLIGQHQFRALGTYVHLSTTGDLTRAIEVTERALAYVDSTCSRFRVDSDLSRANARDGRWTSVDPLLAAAVNVAIEAAHQTDGLVNPCMGRHLIALGYDSDLAIVQARTDPPEVLPISARPNAWREIQVDPTGAVFVPAGVQLDLGATAKAWAADLIATALVDIVGGDCLVSLGGDIRICGEESLPWPIVITEHPGGVGDELDPVEITLDSGGLATSSTVVRRWVAGNVSRHHLIDPRSGRPAEPYWRTVTATGPTCVAANVASTAAIILGADAPRWLTEHGVDARLVDTEGIVHRVGRWPED